MVVQRILVLGFLFLLVLPAVAEEQTIDATATWQTATEMLQDNAEWLDAIGVDVQQAQRLIDDLNQRFQGTHVYDLGALKDNAKVLIPILQQTEETSDYAVWLQSRLDYFEVAEQLRKQAAMNAPKAVRTNAAVIPLPEPSPQMQRKAWLTVVEERPLPPLAQKHVPKLKKIFAEEKVPTELVWLAEVESSFNPRARSPVGAAGLFQLMPTTAKSLKLSTGVLGFGDERTDTEKSGRAAASYLRQLYRRFGDWRLALAAYNAGEGRVAELLKKQKARTYEEIASRLPAETQMYVPKVEATIRKREGVALADLKMPKAG